jgi:hypothetical protein
MDEIAKAPPPGGGDGAIEMSFPGGIDCHSNAPETAPAQDSFRNPRAVREAKRLLRLEFLHECAGGIAIHAGLAQTFAEIGDTAGVSYAFRQLFAHAKAAHPIYLELRDEAASNEERRA